MKPTSRLTLDFSQRMVNDLATNNVLRGSWAEQLVAHYLSIERLPENWCYYDMRDDDGREISVKHSVGPRAKFAVGMSQWAWDPELRTSEPSTEGWRGGELGNAQYWCHVYVFAWLPCESSTPKLDEVLDSDRWTFAVLSRADMYEQFVIRKQSPQKTVGLGRLSEIREFIPGSKLSEWVRPISVVEDPGIEGVPPRRMDPRYGQLLGPPVTPGARDVVPEIVIDGTESLSPDPPS